MEAMFWHGSFQIILSQKDLNQISDNYKEMLKSSCDLQTSDGEFEYYNYNNGDKGEIIYEKMKGYFKNKRRKKTRQYLEKYNSGGTFEIEDIDQIIEIQKFECYYSGVKLDKGNFSIDHIVPISAGGSSWPSNLAIVTKEVNYEKRDNTKQYYWKDLSNRFGKEWVERRKATCKDIDHDRKKVDRKRRLAVGKIICEINQLFHSEFQVESVFITLSEDQVRLSVDGVHIDFPKGFIRDRKRFSNFTYYKTIANSILQYK